MSDEFPHGRVFYDPPTNRRSEFTFGLVLGNCEHRLTEANVRELLTSIAEALQKSYDARAVR